MSIPSKSNPQNQPPMAGGTPLHREPCPDRILDDVGGAFAMGAVGGAAFHFLRGAYNSPRGERFAGAANAVRMNAPRVGGGFAAWGGLFSVFDCSLVYLRSREDPWNSILAGAGTGGLLQLRAGGGAAARAALVGGALLALIEGANIVFMRLVMAPPPEPVLLFEDLPPAPAAQSWFGKWFGGGQVEEKGGGGSAKTEVLESFDMPPPPPNFDF